MLLWSGIMPVYVAFRYLRNMRNGRKQVPEILVSKWCDFSVSLQGDVAICCIQKQRRTHERPKQANAQFTCNYSVNNKDVNATASGISSKYRKLRVSPAVTDLPKCVLSWLTLTGPCK
jgi:hypothetical protein